MTHDFDWSKAPDPWDRIGHEWRKESMKIAGRSPPPPKVHPRPHALEAGLKGIAVQRGMTVDEVKARYNFRTA